MNTVGAMSFWKKFIFWNPAPWPETVINFAAGMPECRKSHVLDLPRKQSEWIFSTLLGGVAPGCYASPAALQSAPGAGAECAVVERALLGGRVRYRGPRALRSNPRSSDARLLRGADRLQQARDAAFILAAISLRRGCGTPGVDLFLELASVRLRVLAQAAEQCPQGSPFRALASALRGLLRCAHQCLLLLKVRRLLEYPVGLGDMWRGCCWCCSAALRWRLCRASDNSLVRLRVLSSLQQLLVWLAGA